jgi:hypothetical protein
MVMTPSPEMSYPTAEWLAQDPKYWGKKAAMAVKPAAANTPAPAAAPKP